MKPHENGLIVLDNESPTEIMGAQLLAMKERGLISLFPAKYRIRKSID